MIKISPWTGESALGNGKNGIKSPVVPESQDKVNLQHTFTQMTTWILKKGVNFICILSKEFKFHLRTKSSIHKCLPGKNNISKSFTKSQDETVGSLIMAGDEMGGSKTA